VRATPEEFIAAWQSSNSVAEVARKIGSRKQAVRTRAYRYRQLGISLKEFPPVELPDWDELAEYAASLLPKDADSLSAGNGGRDGVVSGEEPVACDQNNRLPVHELLGHADVSTT
jgi:hypothetical protein